MLVARSTTTKQSQRCAARIPKLMLLSGQNSNGISNPNILRLILDPHFTFSFKDEINFLGFRMVMLIRATSNWNGCFGKTLVSYGRIPISQQFTNLRPILGHKGLHLIEVYFIHKINRNELPDQEEGNIQTQHELPSIATCFS